MNLWQQRWALFGDSIQAWVFDDYSTNPPNPSNLTAVRISSQYNAATIQNLSCPGQSMYAAQADYNDIKRQAGLFGLNGIIVTLGTNDLSDSAHTVAEFKAAYKAYVAGLRTFHAGPIVLVSPVNRYDTTVFPGGKTMAQIRQAVAEVAAEAGAGVYYLNGGANEVFNESRWFNDGVHFNNGGHWLFSTWLYNQVHALGLW